MIYGLWQSAGGLQAQDYRQMILANNLANADTPGFKADRVAFVERLSAARARGGFSSRHPTLDAMTGGVFETPVYIDYSQGPLTPTDNRLDLALQGDGFFRVRTEAGEFLTRDGRLSVSRDGALLHSASGGQLLDVQGLPIRADAARLDVLKIDTSGTVRQGETVAGQIAVADVKDRSALRKVGENLYTADGVKPTASRAEIRQGFLEGSGLEPIAALVDMIAASRAYQMNATMISLQDESLGRMVNQLGRIG